MIAGSQQIATRQKLILTGLYLSKYDSLGLKKLGFDSFVEAFNVIGYAMGSKPASIKNYRDEFDPLFPNRRKGWHKRPIRDHCRKVFETYKDLDFESFSGLIKSFVGYDENVWSELQEKKDQGESESQFAKRLITGLAAEHYFESVQPGLSEFKGCVVENTTRLGCGYGFRLHTETPANFLAVEVKGLTERTGSLSLTPKEHGVAAVMKDRFFLFIVKNFRESPFHEIFQDPLLSRLQFKKTRKNNGSSFVADDCVTLGIGTQEGHGMPHIKKLNEARRCALITEARAGLIPASDSIDRVHRTRVRRIGRVVNAYAKLSGTVGNRDHLAITDMLADLRHYCDRGGLALHELDAAAEQQYLEDVAEISWVI